MRTKMKELINEVITIVTATGEYVGKLDTLQQDDTSVVLSNPRMIIQNQEGQMGFARGVAVTGEENPKTMVVKDYIFMCATNDKVTEAYNTATGEIHIPEKKIIT